MKILVDCDPGIDDTAALLLVIGRYLRREIELIGVSTVGGNTPVAQTTRAAALVLALTGTAGDVPLAQGFDSASLPSRTGFHGTDGMGEEFFDHLDAPSPRFHEPEDVVNLLADQPDVTVLCTGPLTNAALWLPLMERHGVQPPRWVVMGGAFWGHQGNLVPGVEFNFGADPGSASAFFAAAHDVDVLPLNVSQSVSFGPSQIESVKPSCPWLARMLTASLRAHEAAKLGRLFWLHDLLTAELALEPDKFELVPGTVHVDDRGRSTLSDGRDSLRMHRVARTTSHGVESAFESLRSSVAQCAELRRAFV